MANTCRYKSLVIDNEDLWEISNLARKVNSAVKHPEPVLKMDAPWNLPGRRFSKCNVLHDDQEQKFRMWICTADLPSKSNPTFDANLGERVPTSYATSDDGIRRDMFELPFRGCIVFLTTQSSQKLYRIPK